jgi:AcrR family transcriptional regulator
MTAAVTDELEGPRSKRRRILEVAIDHFGESGFEHTKWGTVAKDVGIGQTALYHYFESKTHCLLTIMTSELLQAQARSRAAIEGLADPEEVLRAAVASAFQVSQREALQARILLSHQDLLVAPRPSEREEAERVRARELVREIETEWAAMLRSGMDSGAFTDRDEKILTRLVLGLVNSVWRWYRPGGAQSLQQVSDAVVDSCVRLVR